MGELGKPPYHKSFQTGFKKLIIDTNSARMLCRRQWVLDHIFNVTIDIDLLKCYPHGPGFGVCEHDKLGIGRGFVVVEFVLRGPIREKAEFGSAETDAARSASEPVVISPQLSHHVSQ